MKGCDNVSNEIIVPTGKIIKNYLSENDINQKELSARIGISEKHISNIINGNSRLTEEFALKLEKVLLGVPASYWLNYEMKYREKIARDLESTKFDLVSLEKIATRFKFKEVFSGLDLTLLEQALEMLKLLKISDFKYFESAYANLSVDFMEDGGEKEAIAIWLNLCEAEILIQNSDLEDIKYSQKELENSLEKFKLLAFNSATNLSLKSCVKLCNKLGIYLVVCGAIKNSKVRGALTNYKDHPTIYISGRFKSHDNIWFALMHEIGHLIKHYDKKEIIISFEDSEKNINKREEEANEFARNFFINPNDYIKFINKKEFTLETINEFARQQNVLPGIVTARLQHDNLLDYDRYNFLKN